MSAPIVEARRLLAVPMIDLPYDAETLMAVIIEYRTALQALLDEPNPATSQLAAIRLVLDSFDWPAARVFGTGEDALFALEQIEDVLNGGDR